MTVDNTPHTLYVGLAYTAENNAMTPAVLWELASTQTQTIFES